MSSQDRSLIDETIDLYRQLANDVVGARRLSTDEPDCDFLFQRIQPFLSHYGITRVGALTDLDTIGIPVFFACRPNSRSLSVCQGKSLSVAEARIGAIMECLEQAMAEHVEHLIVARGTPDLVEQIGFRCIDVSDFLRTSAALIKPSDNQSWVQAISLKTGSGVLVPTELAALDFTDNEVFDHRSYSISSVGLGAGSSLEAAILHALFEVVEYNSTAAIEFFGLLGEFAKPIVLENNTSDALNRSIKMVESAGLSCKFFYLSSDIQIVTVAAIISSVTAINDNTNSRTFAGFSCNLDPQQAALSALLEAVQSRLTQISGARDDLELTDYSLKDYQIITCNAPMVFLDELHSSSEVSIIARLRKSLQFLWEAGVKDLFVVPLGGIEDIVRVVRVLVPSLEAPAKDRVTRTGIRTIRALLEQVEDCK